MSTELLEAVSDLTGAVEEKVQGMARASRQAADELAGIKALLARGTATESKADREHRAAFRHWLKTKDTQQLSRVASEHKDLYATSGAGALAIPKTLADAILFVARTSCPWLDPELCGLDFVGPDFRQIIADGNADIWSVTETGTRELIGTGGFREVVPAVGLYGAWFQASEWALQDIPRLEAVLVQTVADQVAEELATDFLTGTGADGRVLGLLNTTPTAQADDELLGSPLAARAYPALQSVAAGATSPVTYIASTDIARLLGEFRAKYLNDPSFALVMNPHTWGDLLAAEGTGGGALSMPRQRSIFGYRVELCEAVDQVAAGKYPVLAGAWKRAYTLVTRDPTPQLTLDEHITSPGYVRWHSRQRIAAAVADSLAAKVLAT